MDFQKLEWSDGPGRTQQGCPIKAKVIRVRTMNRRSCVKMREATLGLDKLLVGIFSSVTETKGLWGYKAHGKRGGEDAGTFNERCREEGRVLRGLVLGMRAKTSPTPKACIKTGYPRV